ncbi:MAG: ABC transporter transmembrane domain-containing protein, partial [Alphaproteobacteria bacterium]
MFGKFIADLQNRMLWRLVRENLRAQAFNYSVAIGSMFLIAATTSATALVMRDVINSLGVGGSKSQVWMVAGTVALIFTIKGLASYTQFVFLAKAGNSIVAHQQRKIYDKVLGQGVAYFRGQVSSDLLMRVSYSTTAARSVLETLVTGFLRDLLTAIGLAAVMIYQQPTLSLIALVFGPVALLGVREILKRVRRVMNQDLQSLAEIINVVQETSNGIRVIKAFALEGWMAQRMATAVK